MKSVDYRELTEDMKKVADSALDNNIAERLEGKVRKSGRELRNRQCQIVTFKVSTKTL